MKVRSAAAIFYFLSNCCTSFVVKHSRIGRQLSLFGYVPPERDPEYRTVIKKSLLLPIDDNELKASILPVPKDGDIVQCKGKWGTNVFGRIRSLYRKGNESWIADVIPLTEGKTENVYTIDKTSAALDVPVDDLVPLRAYFIRAENGHKISFKTNSTEPICRAPSYKKVGADFTLPRQTVNMVELQKNLDDYKKLKERIVFTTLKYGGVGTVISALALGIDTSITYALGVGSGLLYFAGLGKRVDSIGAGMAVRSNATTAESRADKLLANGRLAAPVLLVAAVAFKNVLLDQNDHWYRQLNLLTQPEFFSAMLGFLTYKVAIFTSEVVSEVREEDWLSFLPGSMAEGVRLKKKMDAGAASTKESDQPAALTKLVFITGPRAGGRANVARTLVQRKASLGWLKYACTDMRICNKFPDRFSLVTAEELQAQRDAGNVLYEGPWPSPSSALCQVALLVPKPLDAGLPQKAYLVEDTPPVLDALGREKSLRLINIWISMQTKEQFISKSTEIVQNEILEFNLRGADDKKLAQTSAREVSTLVNDAARDITFYMQKAPLFEYTLLNSGSDEETVDELQQLIDNVIS